MNWIVFFTFFLFRESRGEFFYYYTTQEVPYQQHFVPTFVHSSPNDFFNRAFTPYLSPNSNPFNNIQPSPDKNDPKTEPQLFTTGPKSQFGGFAYQTNYDDGATSKVVFLTGPDSAQLPNFGGIEKARTLSSNILDANAFENTKDEINDALAHPVVANPASAISEFFKSPTFGFQNFYFRNEGNKYPANTAPLSTTEAVNTTEKEEQGAESIVNDTRVPVNEVTTTISRVLEGSSKSEELQTTETTESATDTTEINTTTQDVTM